MVFKLVIPNCKGSPRFPRTIVREPLTRQHLIEKTIPYSSYVSRRSRELGLYDVGLTSIQISQALTELKQVYDVKNGLDKNDIDSAIANAKMVNVNKNFPVEQNDLLKDIRDTQREMLKIQQDRQDSNITEPVRRIESGTMVGERDRLSRPQEVTSYQAVKSEIMPSPFISELKERLAKRNREAAEEGMTQTMAQKYPALEKAKEQISAIQSRLPPAPPMPSQAGMTPVGTSRKLTQMVKSVRERLMEELEERLKQRSSAPEGAFRAPAGFFTPEEEMFRGRLLENVEGILTERRRRGEPPLTETQMRALPLRVEKEVIERRQKQRQKGEGMKNIRSYQMQGRGMCGRALPVAMPNVRIMRQPTYQY
jgi:hypothetical protein